MVYIDCTMQKLYWAAVKYLSLLKLMRPSAKKITYIISSLLIACIGDHNPK